jgi:predicted Zn-dependent protease
MGLLAALGRCRQDRASSARRFFPTLETLESRLVPYAVTGNSWPHPQLVTISFVPDGTLIAAGSNGNIYSNLFSTFNARWSTATWQKVILKAAQSWAQQTNVNFALVPDNGAASGSGNYQQGDPGFGDIRITGYNFGNGYLAVADMPPPANNYSIAGDITFNTGQPFNIGSTYDLYTVAAHEFGHALGLGESSNSSAVMYGTYTSAKTGLNSDDMSGIRSIYSNNNPRSTDIYRGVNGSFATAANLSSQVNTTSLTAVVNNLDITTTSQVEYFTFTAPSGTNGTLTVVAQSSGLSLLAPTLTVYAANQTTVLGSVSGAGQYGTTLTVKVSGVSAGQQFYVKVAGADATAFGTGRYCLTLNFGTGPAPQVAVPNTQTANGSPLTAGGGQPQSTPTLLGTLINTVTSLADPLLGLLLGISTTVGIGAGVGDPSSPAGMPDDAALALPPLGGAAPGETAPQQGQPALAASETFRPRPVQGSAESLLGWTGAANGIPAQRASPMALAQEPRPGVAVSKRGAGCGGNGGRVDFLAAAGAAADETAATPRNGRQPSARPENDPKTADAIATVAGWQKACTAAFSDQNWTSTSPADISDQFDTDPATSISDPGTAAGLAILLAGYWSYAERNPERRKGLPELAFSSPVELSPPPV